MQAREHINMWTRIQGVREKTLIHSIELKESRYSYGKQHGKSMVRTTQVCASVYPMNV